ncbi:hypothetical protein BDQ17DRAFT_1528625 [Cyathus striatus]|nr:hypothetical protein BDQ17DRAFT_1528625 [Cyathus striatus]
MEAAWGIASHTWKNSSTLYTAGDMVAEGTFWVLGMVNYVTGKGKLFAHGACWIGGRTSVIGSCATGVMPPHALLRSWRDWLYSDVLRIVRRSYQGSGHITLINLASLRRLLREKSIGWLGASGFAEVPSFVIFTPLVVYACQASQWRDDVLPATELLELACVAGQYYTTNANKYSQNT